MTCSRCSVTCGPQGSGKCHSVALRWQVATASANWTLMSPLRPLFSKRAAATDARSARSLVTRRTA
eukprot:1017022-Pyramimonas_sp.AAC.1